MPAEIGAPRRTQEGITTPAAPVNVVYENTASSLALNDQVRRYLHRGWDLSELDFGHVLEVASRSGLRVDSRTGAFIRAQ